MDYGDFDEIKCIYTIDADIINLTPISIRSGRNKAITTDNPIVLINNIPYIPGSTLKGVLRAEAERWARAIGEKVCDIMNPDKENDGELWKKENNKNYTPCIVCRVFGGPTIASHITFENAVAQSWSIENVTRVAINRYTGGQHVGKLFDVEYISPSSRFSWRVIIENIDILDSSESKEKEVKMIMYLFKKLKNGDIYIGGYKSVGFGRIKAEIKKVTKLKVEDGEFKEKDVTEDFIRRIEE